MNLSGSQHERCSADSAKVVIKNGDTVVVKRELEPAWQGLFGCRLHDTDDVRDFHAADVPIVLVVGLNGVIPKRRAEAPVVSVTTPLASCRQAMLPSKPVDVVALAICEITTH